GILFRIGTEKRLWKAIVCQSFYHYAALKLLPAYSVLAFAALPANHQRPRLCRAVAAAQLSLSGAVRLGQRGRTALGDFHSALAAGVGRWHLGGWLCGGASLEGGGAPSISPPAAAGGAANHRAGDSRHF